MDILVSCHEGEVDYMGHVGFPTGHFLGRRELRIGDIVHVNESNKNIDCTNVICLLGDKVKLKEVGNQTISELDISHIVIPYDAPTEDLNNFLEKKSCRLEKVVLSEFWSKYAKITHPDMKKMFVVDSKDSSRNFLLVDNDTSEPYGVYASATGVTYKGLFLCVGDEVEYVNRVTKQVTKGVIALRGNMLDVLWLENAPVLVDNPAIFIYKAIDGGLKTYPYLDIGLCELKWFGVTDNGK